jgi:hypothetical protein
MNQAIPDILTWIRQSNMAAISRRWGKSYQMVGLIAKNGFSQYVQNFSSICEYLEIPIERLSLEKYPEQLKVKRVKIMKSTISISYILNIPPLSAYRMCTIKSKEIQSFIKLFKLYKNNV